MNTPLAAAHQRIARLDVCSVCVVFYMDNNYALRKLFAAAPLRGSRDSSRPPSSPRRTGWYM